MQGENANVLTEVEAGVRDLELDTGVIIHNL